jgi:lipopolysaccharide/colanic/teichoic acid biosynthesis glycosyltransferase
MSLIGPRPERPDFVRLFERNAHRYSDRHRVKSGITGWVLVHGHAARRRSGTASSGMRLYFTSAE